MSYIPAYRNVGEIIEADNRVAEDHEYLLAGCLLHGRPVCTYYCDGSRAAHNGKENSPSLVSPTRTSSALTDHDVCDILERHAPACRCDICVAFVSAPNGMQGCDAVRELVEALGIDPHSYDPLDGFGGTR